MRHRSNCDWVLFLTSPMTFSYPWPVFTKPNILTPRPQLLSIQNTHTDAAIITAPWALPSSLEG